MVRKSKWVDASNIAQKGGTMGKKMLLMLPKIFPVIEYIYYIITHLN